MPFSTVPSIDISLEVIGNLIIWVAAMAVALGIVHTKIVVPTLRHIFKELLVEHLWEVKKELAFNDGSTVKDKVFHLDNSMSHLQSTLDHRLTRLEAKVFDDSPREC